MANVRISDLTAASSLAASDQFEINAAGTSKSATAQKIADFLASVSQTLTQKTFDTAGAGNSFKINGTAISAVTGTGSVVLSASPTLTGTLSAATISSTGAITSQNIISSINAYGAFQALQTAGGTGFRWALGNNGTFILQRTTDGFSTATTPITVGTDSGVTFSNALTYGGVTLSNSVTGTGSMVLSASPTLTGTITAPAISAPGSSNLTLRAATGQTLVLGVASGGSADVYISAGTMYPSINSAYDLGGGGNRWATINGVNLNLTGTITYGGVTLSNSVTGTGSMVLSASPTFTGTVTTAALTVGSGSALKLGNAYVAGAPTATGYVTIQDSAGTTYKVLVST